jgi:hypothetical protein
MCLLATQSQRSYHVVAAVSSCTNFKSSKCWLQVHEEITGWTSVRVDELSKKLHEKADSFKSVRAAACFNR